MADAAKAGTAVGGVRVRAGTLRRRATRRDGPVAFALLCPFAVLLAAFTIYPAGKALLDSFHEFSALNPAMSTWVGTTQYTATLQDPSFRRSIANTLLLAVVTVPAQTFIALVLATVLNARIRARGFFRAAFFLPYVTAPVAVGAVMVQLFGPDGVLSRALHVVLGTPDVAWYATDRLALILVAGVMVWTQTGFFTVIYLAGLQSVPRDVLEAAAVDGAGRATILVRIVMPLLRPTTALVLVMGGTVALQAFEQPYVLSTTGGALPGSPDDATLTMVMYLYAEAFRYHRLGQASAAAFLVTGVILLFSIMVGLLQRRRVRP